MKHAIVLLQIAKNASCPEKKADSTEDIAGVHVTQKKVVFFLLKYNYIEVCIYIGRYSGGGKREY